MDENVRAYIYRVSLALLPILTVYGVVEESKAPLIIAAVAAILNVGLAVKNTSTEK